MAKPIIVSDGPFKGWLTWPERDTPSFLHTVGMPFFRKTSDDTAEFVAETAPWHVNDGDNLHGGYLMTIIDAGLFAVSRAVSDVGGVTISCNTEFLNAGNPHKPIHGVGRIMRETGKLMFVQGSLDQDGVPICAYSGVLRKIVKPFDMIGDA